MVIILQGVSSSTVAPLLPVTHAGLMVYLVACEFLHGHSSGFISLTGGRMFETIAGEFPCDGFSGFRLAYCISLTPAWWLDSIAGEYFILAYPDCCHLLLVAKGDPGLKSDSMWVFP